MVNAYAGQKFHAAGFPEDPEWHDVSCFHSSYLMDDQVLSEPMLAQRPFMSTRRAIRGTRGMLGQEAVNEKKLAEEGFLELRKTVWGIEMQTPDKDGDHFGAGSATLPRLKLEKCKKIFQDPSLDPGTRHILLHTVQVGRGTGSPMTGQMGEPVPP